MLLPQISAMPGMTVLRQPFAASQLSAVHALPSSQFTAAPPHLPPLQMSPLVQAFASLQATVLGVFLQPLATSQLSSVHGLLSSQTTGLPAAQVPPLQASPLVQAEPSSQGAELLKDRQPLVPSHTSVVQAFPSSQVLMAPATQSLAAQRSPTVHGLPSSQRLPLAIWLQPLALSQESLVQRLPSSQFRGALPLHTPAAQLSTNVQALPSLQSDVLLV